MVRAFGPDGFGLELAVLPPENDGMEIPGHVHNGVVVLEGGVSLPEGTAVVVSCAALPKKQAAAGSRRRVQLPLVRSDRPGSRTMTADRVAELLEEEDVSA
jgi:hypothetical protein